MSSNRKGRVPVRGVSYYYEVHGDGPPVLLLHGGLMSIDLLGPILPALAKSRQVIAVDQHGHGRTALGDRPLRLPDIADDLADVLSHLGVAQADVVGYSFGAAVALRLAIQHPARVRRLVLASTAFSRDGFLPDALVAAGQVGGHLVEAMKPSPMYRSYMAIAPDPSELPRLLDQMGETLRTPFDWSDEVRRLAMPVMLVYGDADTYRLEHIVEFYRLLGGGQRDAGWQREHVGTNRLAILPNVTHYEVFTSPALLPVIEPFLDGY
ncbi:MAG TPA: alpha/beta fold hydrolase [Kofleriaceae bacterium]|nr:alpha/beta fold hydrolase [Kofleriaceae bacterium]